MSVVFPAPLGPIGPVMRPRGTTSETADSAFKPSNWTLTSDATKSKSAETIETPFQTRSNRLIFGVAPSNCKTLKNGR
jgi:hypothetical protein